MRSNRCVTRVSWRLSSNGQRRSDSITNIAHQLGYFETVATTDVFTSVGSRIASVTVDQVGNAARELFRASNRTIGWFDPLPIGEGLKPRGSSLPPGA